MIVDNGSQYTSNQPGRLFVYKKNASISEEAN